MPVPAIQLQRLTKQRGRKVLLSELDLVVFEGEILGLVGVNGAGKTTVMKCLLDLDTVTSGEITFFNMRHSRVAAREHLAYLPENFRPPAYLSGWEYLRYMSHLHGNHFKPDGIQATLEILDLEISELDKLTVSLSRGTAQKLGLAGCLMSGKKLLIMDEPMSGLDPRTRIYLRHHLLELKRRRRTCFFTTHLLADVEKLCDRIAILHQGKIRYVGSPAACRRHFRATDLEQAYLRCVGGRGPVTDGENGEYAEH